MVKLKVSTKINDHLYFLPMTIKKRASSLIGELKRKTRKAHTLQENIRIVIEGIWGYTNNIITEFKVSVDEEKYSILLK